MLTDAELLELLQANESDRVERKRSATDRSAIRRTICALANDLPGHGKPGVIFIGMEDDGSCANFEINDELLNSACRSRNRLCGRTAIRRRNSVFNLPASS
jgi:ATP-dependent DNA helicase RecG